MLTRLFLLTLLILCFSLTSYAQDEYLFNTSTISGDLKTNANAVVRLNDINVIIDSQDKINFSLKRIITVFNEVGNQFVSAYASYDKSRKVKQIQARIFDEQGKQIKKIQKRRFHRS